MISTKPHLAKVFIGIDLAWGDKNASGFAVLDENATLLEYQLLFSLDDIISTVQCYVKKYEVYVGVDAPMWIENEHGNREGFFKRFFKI